MKKSIFVLLILAFFNSSFAQVGINTDNSAPDPSSMLDVKSTDKGVVLPRMTLQQRNSIQNPTEGLMVYCTNCGRMGAGGALSIFSNGAWTVIGPCAINPVTSGTHTISLGQILWQWTGTSSGVKWNTTNDFDNATDLGYATSKTETGIFCGQTYTRYVWNYSECGVAGVTSVTATIDSVDIDAPETGIHTPSYFEIAWNWYAVSTATGYKWSATNDFTTATDMGVSLTKTETGLNCNTLYTRYIWAYNGCGVSSSTIITASTSPPPNPPLAGTHVPSLNQIVWNWNPSSGAFGYKWNTVNNYSTATNLGTYTSTTETGLNCGTSYTKYLWAYNACGGTASATILTQSTVPCSECLPFTDIRDGKNYNTVLVESQCWMAQNLNIGTKINGSQNQTNNQVIEKYCFNNLESNCDIYGGLYMWDEAMQYVTTAGVQGICPAGWHLPTDAEWTTLTNFLGGESVAGGKMKEIGTTHWKSPNTGATNSSGFTALPGGEQNYGNFYSLTFYTVFYSSSLSSMYSGPWIRVLSYDLANVTRDYLYFSSQMVGYSVRCVMN